jgi:glycine/D-amino acid oxidase-like deaminating enzyme
LGLWLQAKCQAAGVKILTSCTIRSVDFADQGILRSVHIKSPAGLEVIPCQDLVFAAGAKTPQIFRGLFPSSDIDFTETVNSGNWIVVKSPVPSTDFSYAEVILDRLVADDQLEFVGRRDIDQEEDVVWVCGINDQRTPLGHVGENVQPDEEAISRLIDHANRYLASPTGVSREKLQPLAKGRTYRPTIARDLPIIASVPSSKLLLGGSKPATAGSTLPRQMPSAQIHICTGHGRHGLTLGIGSGKLMSQMVLGKTPDFDMSNLGLPGENRLS